MKRILIMLVLAIAVISTGCAKPQIVRIFPYEDLSRVAIEEIIEDKDLSSEEKATLVQMKMSEDIERKKRAVEMEKDNKLSNIINKPVTPLRTPDTILRVLVLPYEDSNGVLNGWKYSYVKVDNGKWIMADYLNGSIKSSKLALTPLKTDDNNRIGGVDMAPPISNGDVKYTVKSVKEDTKEELKQLKIDKKNAEKERKKQLQQKKKNKKNNKIEHTINNKEDSVNNKISTTNDNDNEKGIEEYENNKTQTDEEVINKDVSINQSKSDNKNNNTNKDKEESADLNIDKTKDKDTDTEEVGLGEIVVLEEKKDSKQVSDIKEISDKKQSNKELTSKEQQDKDDVIKPDEPPKDTGVSQEQTNNLVKGAENKQDNNTGTNNKGNQVESQFTTRKKVPELILYF